MTAVTVKVLVQQNITRVAVAGMRGQQGVGLPSGGETGQLLAKLSDDPYDIGFVDPDSIPERVTEVTATAPITSTGGSTPNIGISPATVSAAGSMSALDKAKLDGVIAGATNTPLSNNTPQTVASGSSAGFATTASRSDHAHAHGTQAGGSLHALATSSASGFMSPTQANKLAAIADGAQVNVPTNLGVGGSGNARTITSSTGTAAALPLAASGTAGLMSTGEHNKLAGVADGATAYTDALARGQVSAMLVEGANVTLTPSGSGDSLQITISATGSGGGGSGTVTSVGLSLPAELSVSGSPVTSSGTLSATWADQPANRVFAGPATGADATPGLRALVAADIPGLPPDKIRYLQEARLLGWGQFIDSLGSATQIELGAGFSFDGNTLNFAGGAGVRTITVGFDGGVVEGVNQSVLVNSRIELRAEYGFDVDAWTLLPKAGSTGNITVEIRKRPFASGSFTAITDGAPPSISSGARGTASVTTWTTVDDGDLIEFEITALTGFVSGIVLQLRATQV